jgi:S1-C subfamily serine protease
MIPKKSLYAMAKALEGVPVLGSLAGSPAARAGIRYGDILLMVNGVRTTTVVEYIQARSQRDDGMDVVVFRAGEEHHSSLQYDGDRSVDPMSLLSEIVTMRVGPIDEVDSDPSAAS